MARAYSSDLRERVLEAVAAGSSARAAVNPIELAFAKLKALLKAAAERTREALWHRISRLLDSLTPTEGANMFAAAGHVPG